jgi:hypothetical protein
MVCATGSVVAVDEDADALDLDRTTVRSGQLDVLALCESLRQLHR